MRGVHAFYLPLLGVLILFNLVLNSKNELTQMAQLYLAERKSKRPFGRFRRIKFIDMNGNEQRSVFYSEVTIFAIP